MSGVTIRIDDTDLQRGLQRMARRAQDTTPLMRAIGEAGRAHADLSFRTESDPEGNPWEPLSAVTLSRRRGSSAQILSDTRRLANSLTIKASRKQAKVGTNTIYAATHQFGRADNRFYNTSNGASAPIPARPFLPTDALPDALREEVLDLVQRHLEP